VQGGGRAAHEAGAAVNIHLDPRGSRALEVLEVLVGEGVPADRVIFSQRPARSSSSTPSARSGTTARTGSRTPRTSSAATRSPTSSRPGTRTSSCSPATCA
jgi:hypothetical protein